MKCEQIKNLLSSYIDGMVDKNEQEMVEAHIAVCMQCRKQVEEYRHIANLMQQMEPPSLPGNFTSELNRRIRDEHNKILGSYSVKTPKKSGWFAAALAVFALTGGIYASSHWSLGSFVTAWHDSKENQKKPLISIDNIIERFQNWKDSEDSKVDSIAEAPDDNINRAIEKPKMQVKNVLSDPADSPPIDSDEVMSSHTTVLKVESIEESLPQALKIAANHGAGLTIIPAEDLPEDSQRIAQGILLEVAPSEAEKIIAELEVLGSPVSVDEIAFWSQVRDSAKTGDSESQSKSGNEETPAELLEETQAEPPVEQNEQAEEGEPRLLSKQETPPDQLDEDSTNTQEDGKDNKVTISIYLIQENEQVIRP
ncbi:MAG: zf-HC2 domain-containing protein [Syntrophomonadaceae bacterium]|nr:zf-HC2 domain-containing protein [Syntrophomonadaceae bacterium]MDD3023422.1 zf-HC2 domain-containing protein [Syntrophomonadaceae bacterium]